MQPNKLINSKYSFSVVENRLYYKILYNVQKQNANSRLLKTRMTVEELKSILHKKSDCTVQAIMDTLEKFISTTIEFDYLEDGTNKVITFCAGFLVSYHFDHEEQAFDLEVHEVIHKHITDFVKMQKEGYSPINLDILFKFKSIYAQRLYTLIRLWSRKEKRVNIKFKVATIRSFLRLENLYPAYADFKRRVLQSAIREINARGNMSISFETGLDEIRVNRRVESIILHVTDHETRQYFKKEEVEAISVPAEPKKEEEVAKSEEIFEDTSKVDAPVVDNPTVIAPAVIEVAEGTVEKFQDFKKQGLYMLVSRNTVFEPCLYNTFVNDFNFLAEYLLAEHSPYINMLFIAQAKALEKDSVNTLTPRQYQYFKSVLMDLIITYDLKHTTA